MLQILGLDDLTPVSVDLQGRDVFSSLVKNKPKASDIWPFYGGSKVIITSQAFLPFSADKINVLLTFCTFIRLSLRLRYLS
jgi:hypothetical protein